MATNSSIAPQNSCEQRHRRFTAVKLVEATFEQPYCRVANLVTAGIAKRRTASVYLGTLADIGVLTPVQMGREKLFVHRALLRLLSSDANDVTTYTRPV